MVADMEESKAERRREIMHELDTARTERLMLRADDHLSRVGKSDRMVELINQTVRLLDEWRALTDDVAPSS